MKVYIAGPMSGFSDFNFPAFDEAAFRLRYQGNMVFNPAEKDRETWGDMATIKAKANYRDCLRIDLNTILDWAEAVYMLKGWENSQGARIEHALAVALKLNIMYE